jgi:hypothetical protein
MAYLGTTQASSLSNPPVMLAGIMGAGPDSHIAGSSIYAFNNAGQSSTNTYREGMSVDDRLERWLLLRRRCDGHAALRLGAHQRVRHDQLDRIGGSPDLRHEHQHRWCRVAVVWPDQHVLNPGQARTRDGRASQGRARFS